MKRLIASNGLYRHWQELGTADQRELPQESLLNLTQSQSVKANAVYTLNVSPDSVYGRLLGYTFATHGLLTLGNTFDQWHIEAVTTVPEVLRK
ncbi:MAG: hypothetical protein O3C21_13835 [Verrucomicrobia bacterium]|nr:hypothetical protein [Verrucomicrobiota bacterium]